MDTNENGLIEPDEITPLARPYLERITEVRRMSLNKPNPIDRLQEAARIYYALRNGVAGRRIESEVTPRVKGFGADPGEPVVPEFGLAKVKYAYTQDDLDEADDTLRRSDRDDDGYIDEREAARARWTHRNPFEMDLDNDGRLSRLELAQRYARRRMLEGVSDELVQKARRTGNGIEPSTREEARRDDSQWWRRGGSDFWLTASLMGRFDSNRNGRLEKAEVERLGIPVARIDIDRDGEVSREELHAYMKELQDATGSTVAGLPAWFYELDEDGDGQVAAAEFTTEWTDQKLAEFGLLDTNGDGLLTSSEVAGSKAMVGGTYRNDDAEVLPPRKTIISEIEVTEDYLIGDLNVQLSITHSHVAYLDAYLTGPDGQRIELFTEVGGSGDNFEDTILDDQARAPITKSRPPFKESYLPEGLLKRQPSFNHYNGKSVKGVWQLVVRGTRNERFGMLHHWSIIVQPQETATGTSLITSSTETTTPATDATTPQASLQPQIDPNAAASAQRSPTREEYEAKMRAMKEAYAEKMKNRNEKGDKGERPEKKKASPEEIERYKKWIEEMKAKAKEKAAGKQQRDDGDRKKYAG